ncbi:MAG: hypothetical protein QG656_1022, partial [Candidatus Hydrogenedentes bacterium]|nr:hypothetical protein [Candidatus Hydrogenedentota bacterium]
PSGEKALGVYHNYTSLTSALSEYAAAYPNIVRLYSLGQSVQGRELWAMLITDNPDAEEDEPEFKYVSTIHGDEPVGTELCLYLINYLLVKYATDTRISNLVDSTEIWIVPLMNPDGREKVWRYNANSIDLNRNFPVFPGEFTGTHYSGAPLNETNRQIETQHVMRWTARHNFVLSANIHTGELAVNYPYDDDGKPSGTDSPSPDDLMFENVCRRYSVHNTDLWNSPEFTNGITNGAVWYVIKGGMQDWNYRYAGCNEVTIELSVTKWPAESTLALYWANNTESMLAYMEAVHIGVRGLVTDGRTGEPLWAEVRVVNNAQPVATDPDVGDYHRMLLPGTYDLTFASEGYFTKTVEDVVVLNDTPVRVDVGLLDGDIDGDGVIGASDIQLIVNAILGYPGDFPTDLDGGGTTSTDLQLIVNTVLSRR